MANLELNTIRTGFTCWKFNIHWQEILYLLISNISEGSNLDLFDILNRLGMYYSISNTASLILNYKRFTKTYYIEENI